MLRTEGIILSEMKYKETSKILNIYTRKYGKIHVMARGAYKAKSMLTPCTQVFSYNEFLLHKGRNFYYLNQGSLINSFYDIRENVERFIYGCYLLELIEKSTPEEEASEKLFLLLARGLEILSNLDRGFFKFSIAFGLKYISFLGYRPNLDSCVHCGNSYGYRPKFSYIEGGLLCAECSRDELYSRNIDEKLINNMKSLLYTSLDDLNNIEISNISLYKLQKILDEYILYSIDRKDFNSLKMLNTLFTELGNRYI